jgi:hypothetical protein
MLKIFIGVVLGYLLFTSPQARRITGQLLRTAAEVISPETKPALNESGYKRWTTDNSELNILTRNEKAFAHRRNLLAWRIYCTDVNLLSDNFLKIRTFLQSLCVTDPFHSGLESKFFKRSSSLHPESVNLSG